MHLSDGHVPVEYIRYARRKTAFVGLCTLLVLFLLVLSICLGPANVTVSDVIRSLLGRSTSGRLETIVWNIRFPQALTAIVAGAGLALSGAVMQSVLRNPLGSPFTLGISHAAAFGAAFSVMFLGTGTMSGTPAGTVSISSPYVTAVVAFLSCLSASAAIMAVSRMRGASPETMVLTGIALSAIFTAGTMFMQFFADDIQLAAMVFWTFGDVARADWTELRALSAVTGAAAVYFFMNAWSYNAIDVGDETARSLGVRVERVRLTGMLITSLVTAVIISFLGVIGFVGLVCPHIIRRLIGADHRFLLPASGVTGAALLLASDTAARLVLSPHLLPVSVLTAFMGGPVFIYLIVRGNRR